MKKIVSLFFCAIFFLVSQASFANLSLFVAIRANNVEMVAELLEKSGTDPNYQLNAGEFWGTAAEEGMTPLLYALSLERLTSAKILLEKAQNLDVNIKNAAGVSAVHMLAMVEVGDERYNDQGDEDLFRLIARRRKITYHAFTPIVAAEKILTIFDLLLAKGFTESGKFRTQGNEEDQNLIAEALVHGKPYLAVKMKEHNFPLPEQQQALSLSAFLLRAGFSETNKRVEILKDLLQGQPLLTSFFNAARVKEIAVAYSNEESSELNRLIRKMLDMNPQLSARDFKGFLEGCGSDLAESTKKILRFE